jgi:hypothetical protein
MQKLTEHEVARQQMIKAADEALPFVSEQSARIVNEEHAALLEDCRSSRENAESERDRALRIGAELAKIKKGVGHGNFMAWVKANCDFSYDTANDYMHFAAKLERAPNLPDDLSLRQAMIALDIIPHRPREGGGTYRGGGIPSVYDPLNALTRFLGAVDNSGTPQQWETDQEERLAVQQQYKPKLEQLILRLFGVQVELPAMAS